MRVFSIFLLLAAVAARAAAPDPFPNQPGALSAQEIAAATDAMKAQLGGEAAPPLVASGKRAPGHFFPAYVLFATPLADAGGGVRTRRQVICNYLASLSSWQCTKPHDQVHMKSQGLEHVFDYVVDSGRESLQDAVEAVRFLYTPCFEAQYRELGSPRPFARHPALTVVGHGDALTVRAGTGEAADAYRILKTERQADGCGFRIHHVRLGPSGVVVPQGYGQELARQEAREEAGRKKELAERQRDIDRAERRAAPEELAGVEVIATVLMWSAWIIGLLTLVVPWVALAKGRAVAARAAGMLAGVCTLLAVASAFLVPAKYNIRIDLLISAAVVTMAWMVFAGLFIWAMAGKK